MASEGEIDLYGMYAQWEMFGVFIIFFFFHVFL